MRMNSRTLPFAVVALGLSLSGGAPVFAQNTATPPADQSGQPPAAATPSPNESATPAPTTPAPKHRKRHVRRHTTTSGTASSGGNMGTSAGGGNMSTNPGTSTTPMAPSAGSTGAGTSTPSK